MPRPVEVYVPQGLEGLEARQEAEGAVRHAQPVFVDGTGRRRRLAVFAGVGIGVGLLVSLTLIVVGLFSGSPMPVPGWPEPGSQHQQEGNVADNTVRSPTAGPGEPTVSTTGTSTTSGSPGPRPTSSIDGQPAATDQPGLGDQRRATPGVKETKSPGKPR